MSLSLSVIIPPGVLFLGTIPSFIPRKNNIFLVSFNLVLSILPTIIVSIPGGIIPIFTWESPASKISLYSSVVTISSPIKATNLSKTLITDSYIWLYSFSSATTFFSLNSSAFFCISGISTLIALSWNPLSRSSLTFFMI